MSEVEKLANKLVREIPWETGMTVSDCHELAETILLDYQPRPKVEASMMQRNANIEIPPDGLDIPKRLSEVTLESEAPRCRDQSVPQECRKLEEHPLDKPLAEIQDTVSWLADQGFQDAARRLEEARRIIQGYSI